MNPHFHFHFSDNIEPEKLRELLTVVRETMGASIDTAPFPRGTTGVNINALAAASGVSGPTVRKWLAGHPVRPMIDAALREASASIGTGKAEGCTFDLDIDPDLCPE
ncbi:MAG: hypothetical protein HC836_27885 [Richelia sp. RM2_1_2]|nr:hypothetical protein [Richelia sp. RM2_1_2]